MGVFEQVFRPGNEGRQRTVNELVTDIVSDLKYIASSTNRIINTFNEKLGSSVAKVAYNSSNPKQLIQDVSDRYEEIEKLARAKYDNLDAVDKPTLDELIAKWEGKMSPDEAEKLTSTLKSRGWAGDVASMAAGLAFIVVITPTLRVAIRSLAANLFAGVVLGALAGIVVSAIVDAIAAEQNYHELENAIADLTKTKTLLNEYRDKVANAADDLRLSLYVAQRAAKRG